MLFYRHFETFLLPQTIDAFAINTKSSATKHDMYEAITATRVTANQFVHVLDDGMFIVLYLGAITLRATGLTQHNTQTTLRNFVVPQCATYMIDRDATARGADQFGRAASLRIMMSNA